MDIETMMARLAESGVTAIIKADHERAAEGGKYWTMAISGGRLTERPIRCDAHTLEDCVRETLSILQESGDEWEWVEELIP